MQAAAPPVRERARPGARPWLSAAVVAALVLAADQISKHAVEHDIVPGEEHRLLPGVELVNTRNHGVAFSLLPGHQDLITIIISLAVLVLLGYFARHRDAKLMWLPTGMLIGGALGNILDRVRHGSVTDFIKLPLGWPPFNIADAAITVGIVILFLLADHARHRSA